jgi:hypothetical protein
MENIEASRSALKVGAPYDAYLSSIINVPSANGFKLEKVKIIKSEKRQGALAPNPKRSVSHSSYEPNPDKYTNEERKPIAINYLGVAEDLNIAKIEFHPFAYNIESDSFEIIESVEFVVSFTESPLQKLKINSAPTDNSALNAEYSSAWRIDRRNVSNIDKEEVFQAGGNETWFKVAVDKDDAYYLDAKNFADMGVVMTKELSETIRMFNYGGKELSETVENNEQIDGLKEQPIKVEYGINGEFSRVVFYGAATSGFGNASDTGHYRNHYGDKNYYLLSWGGAKGLRAEETSAPRESVNVRPTSYIDRLFYEEEMVNPLISGSGRQWFGRSTFPFVSINQLNNLDRNGKISYSFALALRLTDMADRGFYSIFENSNKISSISLSGDDADAVRSINNIEIDAKNIAADDRSNLRFEFSTFKNVSTAIPFFDWYEIRYPRSFSAIDGKLTMYLEPGFPANIYEITATNFTGSNIYGWDVTNPSAPKAIKNHSATGSVFVFCTATESDKLNKYVISSQLQKPLSIEKFSFPYIRQDTNSVDLIVIAHPDLLASAQKYVEYKNKQGRNKAKVFLTTDLYNEFGSGVADPSAIRNFIAYAYKNWRNAPKFVTLWGDGHFDYKNISTKRINFVPTYETLDEQSNFGSMNSYCTDDYFACVSGNDWIPDVAIGRIPANTNEEGLVYLNKIDKYENSSSNDSWRTNITLVADDSWAGNQKSPDTSTHTNQTEYAANNYVPQDIYKDKIYMGFYPYENVSGGRRKPAVTADIVSSVNNEGAVVLSWVGHGNPRVWAHEEIFDRENAILQFRNLDKLYFCYAATCDFGRFDLTDVQSGAEEMTMYPDGAGIGILTPSRSVYISDNEYFTNAFFESLFKRNPKDNKYRTIGDVVKLLKTGFHDSNSQKYNLLCDPSIRLNIPDNVVELDTINEKELTDKDTVFIKGLSKVSVSGKVKYPNGGIINNFNGFVQVSLREASELVTALDPDQTIYRMMKNGAALNRSSFKVENGRFKGEFFVPKDISFANGLAKIELYSLDTLNKQYAKGVFERVSVNSINQSAETEDKCPEIAISIDSRTFRNGDLVSAVPNLIVDLSDDTGINTSGAGIGHRIEAWLDDKDESIDLTPNFRSSMTNPKAGSVEKALSGLKAGTHRVKIRAWDVFNNYSVSNAEFRIADPADGLIVGKAFASPNPASEETMINVLHNSSEAYDVNIKIYDAFGVLVRTLNARMSDLYNAQVKWDACDEKGAKVPVGAYFIVAEMNTKKENAKGYGQLIITR